MLLWDSVGKYGRPGEATDENTACAHCTLGTYSYKHTNSEYVTINAFPLQQSLRERTSVLARTARRCWHVQHVGVGTYRTSVLARTAHRCWHVQHVGVGTYSTSPAFFIWRRIKGWPKTYIGLHVKCPLFLSYFYWSRDFLDTFSKNIHV
jgi:hypothetical protein